MKGGRTPIHRQPWYPSDYHEDEHVKLLKARRDYLTLTFYRHFLDKAWTAGGDLPADPEALAAVVEMPRKDVERALTFCLGRLIAQEGERLSQKRIKRDLQKEDSFSADQARRGALGAKARWDGERHTERQGARHPGHDGPPLPVPVPVPVPIVPAVPAGNIPAPVAWSREACDAWIDRFGGTAPGGQIGKALRPLVDRHGWEIVRQAWCSYLRQVDPEYASASRFASTFGRWSGTAPPGAKSTVTERTVANLTAWVAGKEGGS